MPHPRCSIFNHLPQSFHGGIVRNPTPRRIPQQSTDRFACPRFQANLIDVDLTSDHPFWTVQNGILANYPPLGSDQSCEVAILGAGITGSLIAEKLTRSGHDVLLVDARDFGRGSTSASTALLQYEIDTHLIDLIGRHGRTHAEQAYLACHESIDLIARLVESLKVDCGFTRKDSVYLASREKDLEALAREARARRNIGIDVREWNSSDVAEKFGFHKPGALYSTQAAEVDSYRLANGLLSESVKRGARMYDRTKVTSVNEERTGLHLTTDRGFSIRASRLIVAAGYEASELFRTSEFVNLNSSFAIASEPIADEHFWWNRCLLWETARPYFYLRSTEDGRAIIGGEDSPFRNPKARDKMIAAKARKLESRFQEMFPGIPTETAFSWAGTFGETEDGLAYIGEHPSHPKCLFALGFGGNGITYSAVAAEILSEALAGRKHPYADTFRFDR